MSATETTVNAFPEMRAIFNDTAVPTVGRLELPTGG